MNVFPKISPLLPVFSDLPPLGTIKIFSPTPSRPASLSPFVLRHPRSDDVCLQLSLTDFISVNVDIKITYKISNLQHLLCSRSLIVWIIHSLGIHSSHIKHDSKLHIFESKCNLPTSLNATIHTSTYIRVRSFCLNSSSIYVSSGFK